MRRMLGLRLLEADRSRARVPVFSRIVCAPALQVPQWSP